MANNWNDLNSLEKLLQLYCQAPPGKYRDELKIKIEALEKTKAEKPIKKRGQPEDDLQIECIKWMDTQPGLLYQAVPNHLFRGNVKSKGAFLGYMAKQKKMGLRKGASDLLVFYKGNDNNIKVCAIELKIGYNKPDTDQQKYLNQMQEIGATSGVARSVNDFIAIIKKSGYTPIE